MIFSRRTLGAFAIGALAVIGAVVTFTDDDHWENVDPRTGEHIPTPAELIQRAIATGDAAVAHAILSGVEPDSELMRTDLQRLLAVLAAELRVELDELAPAHPRSSDRSVLSQRKRNAQSLLDCRGSVPSPAALVKALEDEVGDAPIAAETYALFEESRGRGIDKRAAEWLRTGYDIEAALSLADEYLTLGRGRAAARWARLAWLAAPEDSEVARVLLEVLYATGAYRGAAAVMERVAAPDATWRRRRVQFAAWSRNTLEEARALESVVEYGEADAPDRSRLVDLWIFLGRPDRALPHAVWLAERGTADLYTRWRLPVLLALEAGDAGRALELLRAHREDPDALDEWTELELEVLAGDLRQDELQARLRELARRGHAQYAGRYQAVLERNNDREELLTWYVHRIEAGKADSEIVDEALGLAYVLEHPDIVGWILDHGGAAEPIRELQRLPVYRRIGVPSADERVLALLTTRPLLESEVREGLEALQRQPYDPRLIAALLRDRGPDGGLERMSAEIAADWLDLLLRADPALAVEGARTLIDAPAIGVEVLGAAARSAAWCGAPELEMAARERIDAIAPSDTANLVAWIQAAIAAGQPEVGVEIVRARLTPAEVGRATPELRRAAFTAAAEAEDEVAAVLWAGQISEADDIDLQIPAAETLHRNGRYDLAESLLQRVLARDSTQHRARRSLARIYLDREQVHAAVREYDALPAAWYSMDADARFERGLAVAGAGDLTRARALLSEFTAPLAPGDQKDLDLRRRRATALAASGELRAAYDERRLILGEPAADDEDRAEFVMIAAQLGDDAAVERGLAELTERRQRSGRSLARAARAALDYGFVEPAWKAFEESRRRGGVGAADGFDLARAALALREPRIAAHELEEALRAGGGRTPAADSLLAELDLVLAQSVVAFAGQRRSGPDRIRSGGLYGAIPGAEGRSRLEIGLEHGAFEGRARDVAGVERDLSAELLQVALTATAALDRRHTLDVTALGLQQERGAAEGEGHVGFEALLRRREPGSALWQAAVRVDTPMTDVAAGVALGGRRRSVELDWTGPLTRRTWLDLGARYEHLELDAVAAFGGDVDGPRTSAIASLGTLLYGSRGMTPMVPNPRVLPRDEVSPLAEPLAPGESPLALLGSVAISAQRLGGRARLAQVLPIADQLTEVNAGLRADWRLERSLACSFGGTIGRALEDEATVYRLGAGLGWRPARGFEFTLAAETGRTAGRGVEADETTLSVGATLRR